jgi:preprotein translocase subunit SecA
MFKWIISKIIGSKNQREIRKVWPLVKKINELEQDLQSLTDDQLREKTAHWQEELRAMEKALDKELEQAMEIELEQAKNSGLSEEEFSRKKQALTEQARKKKIERMDDVHDAQAKYLDEIMCEAFAVVKNGARRLCGTTYEVCDQPVSWEMVHFDVQLIGGIGLHRGGVAEMATGEGKTLVATLPVYLNALTGRGVHLITVNDYLARRDSEWMGYLYEFLGLTVGCIQNSMHPEERRKSYGCDITYGTNSEFGFDYLRDNGMASSKAWQVQRGHYMALIDEVDSVLIDEARTPLIISGPVAHSNTHQYSNFKGIVEQLVKKQNLLCNESMAIAKKAFEDGDMEVAAHEMFKTKLGQPKHRGLLRMMEDPVSRKLIEAKELSHYKDNQKRELFELKEELFYHIDEKGHDADLSEKGRAFLNPEDPDAFMLPDLATAFSEIDAIDGATDQEKLQKKEELQKRLDSQGERIHCISQLLKAICLYEKDVDYVVSNNKVVIVDENTGREMPGRRWSDGLHQAVEAKEGVQIDKETQTLATITIQNYFRLYERLGGMTGTAETEAAEFNDIYGLNVLPIPTNRPVQRLDNNDHIYKTRREKYGAAIAMVKETHIKGQPVLVGTASVDASETVSRMLKREKIPHSVLNAKNHRHEAEIISRAGQKGSVTVSTNMAGRGTDIKLGEGVPELGGLLVLATERHESRRIDRQLRGRCARQGDPGTTIFYISFEDDLMRNFGAADRMTKMMERFGLEEGQELQHPWLNRSVETAQKRVEQRNYTIRKRVLEFDDVMNRQREVVYGYRNEVIETADPRELVIETLNEAIPLRVSAYLDVVEGEPDYENLLQWVNMTFPIGLTVENANFESRSTEGNSEFLIEKVSGVYELKMANVPSEAMAAVERHIILAAIDSLWQEHLYGMDALRESVHLRSFAQKDPLIEYKNEAYAMFQELMNNIKAETLNNLFRSEASLMAMSGAFNRAGVQQGRGAGPVSRPKSTEGIVVPRINQPAESEEGAEERPQITMPVIRREAPTTGRNEPCPCGSGKKFKQCCGRSA